MKPPTKAEREMLRADEINALPEDLRGYVHDLETRCDPAGDLRARRVAEDMAAAYKQECERLREALERVTAENYSDLLDQLDESWGNAQEVGTCEVRAFLESRFVHKPTKRLRERLKAKEQECERLREALGLACEAGELDSGVMVKILDLCAWPPIEANDITLRAEIERRKAAEIALEAVLDIDCFDSVEPVDAWLAIVKEQEGDG